MILKRVDMTIYTSSGCHKFPFEEKFKILGCAMNWQGKSHHVYAVFAFWGRELVVDCTDPRQDQRMGNQNNVTSISFQKTKRRGMGRLSCKDMQNGQKDMDSDGLTLCVRSNCRKHVACHGMEL